VFLPLESDRIFESQLGVLPMQVSCDDLCDFESSLYLKGIKEFREIVVKDEFSGNRW
jgi:hypothetical protein